ncbi:MAG: EutN/CcmL family microcompartment protein [Syntrophomonadaceae bacterium]|nr:EutN/CcmL family microcompartment protein [Syntrophomonadaceae bacterium]
MYIAKVIGHVVSTKKDSQLTGRPLLMVALMNGVSREFDKDKLLVAVDSVGSGVGEIVLLVTGSTASRFEDSAGGPVDAAIIGIIDVMEIMD